MQVGRHEVREERHAVAQRGRVEHAGDRDAEGDGLGEAQPQRALQNEKAEGEV